jgi:hypothetical protein
MTASLKPYSHTTQTIAHHPDKNYFGEKLLFCSENSLI